MPMDIVSELTKLEVQKAELVFRDAPAILEAARAGQTNYDSPGNYAYLQSAYLLGHLHTFKHPDNPYFKQPWCAEIAMEFTDLLPPLNRAALAKGEGAATAEWSPLGTLELLFLLDTHLEVKRRADWMEFVESYIAFAQKRPYGFTSPNHEAWRVQFLYRAGHLLNRPALCDLALFFCRQLLTYQTPEGFWEEGRHHGPSMRYNYLMLEPLAWMYRLTEDTQIGAAAQKLSRFMASYAFPDGTFIGAFDGRQTSAVGFGSPICPGLELTPEGRVLNQKVLALSGETGQTKNFLRESAWYAHFAAFFVVSATRYYSELVPESESRELLKPSPKKSVTDAVLENHTPTFDAILARNRKWSMAVSGQSSDIPKESPNIFRLERQSRIEVWHEQARLVLGGGHNRKDWPVPYTNAILDTGFAGETEFGLIDGEKNWRRRSYYLPRYAESRIANGQPEVAVHFAHGTVRFQLNPVNDNRLQIEAHWEVCPIQRLCLQLPLIVWRESKLLLDQNLAVESQEPVNVHAELTVAGGPFQSRVTLTLPTVGETRVRYPMNILRYYIDPAKPDDHKPLFCMALACTQISNPPGSGTATWMLDVSAL